MPYYTLPHTDGAVMFFEHGRSDLERVDSPKPPVLKPPKATPKPKPKVRPALRQPVEYRLPHTNGATIWQLEERPDLVPVEAPKSLTPEPPKSKSKPVDKAKKAD